MSTEGFYTNQLIKDLGLVLAACLQDVVQVLPKDPIDYMAQWLYKYVKNNLYYQDEDKFAEAAREKIMLERHNRSKARERRKQLNTKILVLGVFQRKLLQDNAEGSSLTVDYNRELLLHSSMHSSRLPDSRKTRKTNSLWASQTKLIPPKSGRTRKKWKSAMDKLDIVNVENENLKRLSRPTFSSIRRTASHGSLRSYKSSKSEKAVVAAAVEKQEQAVPEADFDNYGRYDFLEDSSSLDLSDSSDSYGDRDLTTESESQPEEKPIISTSHKKKKIRLSGRAEIRKHKQESFSETEGSLTKKKKTGSKDISSASKKETKSLTSSGYTKAQHSGGSDVSSSDRSSKEGLLSEDTTRNVERIAAATLEKRTRSLTDEDLDEALLAFFKKQVHNAESSQDITDSGDERRPSSSSPSDKESEERSDKEANERADKESDERAKYGGSKDQSKLKEGIKAKNALDFQKARMNELAGRRKSGGATEKKKSDVLPRKLVTNGARDNLTGKDYTRGDARKKGDADLGMRKRQSSTKTEASESSENDDEDDSDKDQSNEKVHRRSSKEGEDKKRSDRENKTIDDKESGAQYYQFGNETRPKGAIKKTSTRRKEKDDRHDTDFPKTRDQFDQSRQKIQEDTDILEDKENPMGENESDDEVEDERDEDRGYRKVYRKRRSEKTPATEDDSSDDEDEMKQEKVEKRIRSKSTAGDRETRRKERDRVHGSDYPRKSAGQNYQQREKRRKDTMEDKEKQMIYTKIDDKVRGERDDDSDLPRQSKDRYDEQGVEKREEERDVFNQVDSLDRGNIEHGEENYVRHDKKITGILRGNERRLSRETTEMADSRLERGLTQEATEKSSSRLERRLTEEAIKKTGGRLERRLSQEAAEKSSSRLERRLTEEAINKTGGRLERRLSQEAAGKSSSRLERRLTEEATKKTGGRLERRLSQEAAEKSSSRLERRLTQEATEKTGRRLERRLTEEATEKTGSPLDRRLTQETTEKTDSRVGIRLPQGSTEKTDSRLGRRSTQKTTERQSQPETKTGQLGKKSIRQQKLSSQSSGKTFRKGSEPLLSPRLARWRFLRDSAMIVCDHPLLGRLRPRQPSQEIDGDILDIEDPACEVLYDSDMYTVSDPEADDEEYADKIMIWTGETFIASSKEFGISENSAEDSTA
ncbi:hypothetical protein ElyMa_001644300 [Elysia marginata]|uniref:Uncharacterized protein n=1 Tax=Elysia marginata TaxID=1093978 RepID=A0AAV4JMT7_9GAST|nr:hypothetical protein ElyMa_001644300 [Elysia marginata]